MKTHHRHFADRAERRTTTSRPLSVAAIFLVLPLVAAACGAEPSADPNAAAPIPTTAVDDDPPVVDVATAIAPGTETSRPTDDLEPDYTDEELEVLLNPPSTFNDVIDAPEPAPLAAETPEAAIEEIKAELDVPVVPASNGTPILDRVQPVDAAPSGQSIGIREGRRINESGEANQLDEDAALACANVEIALTALDDGDTDGAVERLQTASTSAADSTVGAVTPWSAVLEQTALDLVAAPSETDVSSLLAFITTCTEGGYEL